ncbi:MAG: serine/threonine-protein kinase [Polyangiaceae bacterium]
MQTGVPSRPASSFTGRVFDSEVHPGVSYRVERTLGQGGTAVAFFATRMSPEGETPVVVKVILPRLVVESGDQANTIVKKEAVALGRLNERVPPTPFVVRLLDTGHISFDYFGRSLQLPWIALEYVHGGVEGTTLEARVAYAVNATRMAFDPQRAARLVDSLSRGLTEIHAVGVVHRDLTPGNVLCCGTGESEMFKISDFGIAKPAGLSATFGDAIIGTPGYVAPEQIGGNAPVGPQSDVFSFATIVYFVLTGQRYFDVSSPTQALVAVGTPERATLAAAPGLSPELREKEAACQAIDLALARATSPNPGDRPRSAQLFAQSLRPWLVADSPSARPTRRWFDSIQMMRPESSAPQRFVVRFPPGQDRLLLSVGWNASGHCLAASTRGLCYWDGVRWADVNLEGISQDSKFARRLASTSWLIGGAHGHLARFSSGEVMQRYRCPAEEVTFVDASGDPEDLAVLVGERPGHPPELHAVVAKRFLKPMVVPGAATLSGIARLDEESWLVIGRGHNAPFAAIFRPLLWELSPIEVPPGRALLACASSPEHEFAIAVGTGGACLQLRKDGPRVASIEGAPDFASVAVDPFGRAYAAGAGAIWVQRAPATFALLWQEKSWRAPFISVLADAGLVIGVTVDGGIVECRSSAYDATRPAT